MELLRPILPVQAFAQPLFIISASRDGFDKFTKLERLAEMKREGLIDDDEFKQMKKEIMKN